MKLSPKQARFVAEYVVDLNATQAAIRAGYSPKTAVVQGPRLLRKAQILGAVAERAQKVLDKAEVTVERVVQELALLGFADMRHYLTFADDGQVYLDWKEMPDSASRAIQEIVQDEYVEGKGSDARLVRRTKFKLHSKTPALDLLAKYLGMLIHKHEHTGAGGTPLPPTNISVHLVPTATAHDDGDS